MRIKFYLKATINKCLPAFSQVGQTCGEAGLAYRHALQIKDLAIKFDRKPG
jgi:hypothetical protein